MCTFTCYGVCRTEPITFGSRIRQYVIIPYDIGRVISTLFAPHGVVFDGENVLAVTYR